jgi:hypothetical protein
MIAVLVAVDGVELARAAVDPTESKWHFALYRHGAPAFMCTVGDEDARRTAARLVPVPMRAGDVVSLDVRVTMPPGYADVVLWLAALRARWGLDGRT